MTGPMTGPIARPGPVAVAGVRRSLTGVARWRVAHGPSLSGGLAPGAPVDATALDLGAPHGCPAPAARLPLAAVDPVLATSRQVARRALHGTLLVGLEDLLGAPDQ